MASRINKNKVIAAAQKFVQKAQYDRAIREYQKVVEDDPREVRIWLKIGDLHAKVGANGEAIDTYLKVAEFYSEQGFYLKAVAVYKQVLKLNPALVDINLKLAGLYKQLGLLNDAMQQYELVSNHFHREGRTKDALAALRQIVDLDPENVASRIKLAELYSKEQMRDEAVEEFVKAADFLRASARMDDFIKVAERLVFHQPENVAVTRELASLYLRRQDPRRALQKLQLAFKADQRDVATLGMLAQAFHDLGQTAKTVSVLRELAHIHGDNGQEPERVDTFRRILALAPDDEEARRVLGPGGAGRADASELPREARMPAPPPAPPVKRPSAPLASDHLGAGFEEIPSTVRDADERPTSAFRGRQTMPPARPAAATDFAEETARVLTEAEVYIKYGLHDKAIDHLRTVFRHDPQNVEVRLKLRDLFVQVGRFTEAAEELHLLARGVAATDPPDAARYLNEALELDAGNDGARQLLAELEGTAGEGPAGSTPPPYDFEDGSVRSLQVHEDTLDEDYVDEAIDLDADDIVEEIPIDAQDLISDDVVELAPRRPGYDDSPIEPPPAEDRGEPMSGSGIIELSGETTDTLGMGTPSSEVIALPVRRTADARPPLDMGEEHPTSVGDDLEEADFFIQQGLFAEARAILEDVVSRYPRHPLVAAKLADMEELERRAAVAVDASQEEPEGEHTDIAADLAAELDESLAEALNPEPTGDFDVGNVFEEFKRGVENQISDEDSDTHYDLGIAYREMGLMDDAITEFRVAMRSRDKEVLCHMMIGLCHAEKGLMSEAISQFKTGLYVEGITERETIALYFELGHAYEQLSDYREALYYYEKVNKKDPKFRDVASRIERLRRVASEGGNGPAGADGGGRSSGGGPPRSPDGVIAKTL